MQLPSNRKDQNNTGRKEKTIRLERHSLPTILAGAECVVNLAKSGRRRQRIAEVTERNMKRASLSTAGGSLPMGTRDVWVA